MLTVPVDDFNDLAARWKKDIRGDDFNCFDGLCLGDRECTFYAQQLSNLSFTIEDQVLSLSPQAYLIDGIDLDPDFENTCIFGVLPMPQVVTEQQMYLLGDVFLRSFYSVYDF